MPDNNINLTRSTLEKKANSLKSKMTSLYNTLTRKKSVCNQYRGFISRMLNEGKITKEDLIEAFGKTGRPKPR